MFGSRGNERRARQDRCALPIASRRPAEDGRTLVIVGLEQPWKHRCAFFPDGVEGRRIEAQDLQDRGGHLHGFHPAGDRLRVNVGIGYQHHHVGKERSLRDEFNMNARTKLPHEIRARTSSWKGALHGDKHSPQVVPY